MPKYNHAFDIAFSVVSDDPEGNNITPEQYREALLKRLDDIKTAEEWEEALGAPFDTYEVAGD